MPGVTIRKPRLNRLLVGERTALTVCQAISIAITVVLPLPVAIFRAMRSSSGLACSFAPLDVLPELGVALLPARDLGQPDDRLDRLDLAEERPHALEIVAAASASASRAVAGVTPQSAGFGSARHDATCERISLMIGVGLYSCSSVERPSSSLKTRLSCFASFFFCFLGLRNRREELRLRASLQRPDVERLTILVQGVVQLWDLIRRVEDRVLKEDWVSVSVLPDK